MSKEVEQIINTLCEKLGVAANILVPELAKYNIARLAFETAVYAILLVIAVIIVTKSIKYVLKNSDDDMEDKVYGLFLTNFVPLIIIVFLCIATISSATDLIGWIASPTASAVKEITSMIR